MKKFRKSSKTFILGPQFLNIPPIEDNRNFPLKMAVPPNFVYEVLTSYKNT